MMRKPFSKWPKTRPMPARKFMNQTFMVMAIAKGLDGAIMNPLDQKMMAHILAAEALAGRDNFCM